MHEVFAERFASRTRDEWTEVFAGTDACVTPVLTWSEAAADEHLTGRVDGDHRPRRRAGRSRATLLPDAGRAGRAAAGRDHAALRNRLVAQQLRRTRPRNRAALLV